MVQLSMTLSDVDPDFKVTTFFDIEYLKQSETTRDRAIVTIERQ